MPERDRAEKRREKRLRRAQKGVQRHEVASTQYTPTPSRLGVSMLTLGLTGADFFSRMYNIHGVELLSSYGHDVLATPIWWLYTQRIFPRFDFFRSKKNIVLPLALSVGFELMELKVSQEAPHILEQHLLGSARFDPWDFAAYGLGAATAIALHRIFYGRPTRLQQ